ncbi:hypothetical protein T12_8089, partial [Trichinella patagoniensis]
MRVNSAGNTVLDLSVELWKGIIFIDTGLLHIPHGSLLHDIPHQKPLDSFILGAAFSTVGAANK